MQQYSVKNHNLASDSIHDPTLLVPIMKAFFVVCQVKFLAFAFTRYSLLALFLRLFRTPLIRSTCWALIVYLAIHVLAFNLASVFQCTPVSYFWNQAYPSSKGHCVNINGFYQSMPPPEVAVDLILIFLPLPEIWGLRYPRARKVGLTAVFFSGSLALVTNSGRLAFFASHNSVGAVPNVENGIIAWVAATMSCCFIAACIPAMHPLVQRVVPQFIRDAIYRCFDSGARQQPQTMSTLSSTDGDFRKLVESKTSSDPAFAHSVGTTAGHAGDPSSLGTTQAQEPPIDLRDIERGQGVLVKKEIIVTQENMFEDVLGI